MPTHSDQISLQLLLPKVHPSKRESPPSPRTLLSKPMETHSFPLESIHFYNQAFHQLVLEHSNPIFSVQKLLGCGDGGTVYSVRSSLEKESQAIKVLKRSRDGLFGDSYTNGIRNEILLSKELAHIHIIDFYATFEDSGHEYIITEMCEHGSLKSFLRNVRKFNEPESRLLMLQLISAVNYLHNRGITHNDIYPQNILVTRSHTDEGLVIKLTDFGWSEIRIEEDGELSLESIAWTTKYDRQLIPGILLCLLFNSGHVKLEFITSLQWMMTTELRNLLTAIITPQAYYEPEISSLVIDPWFWTDFRFIRNIPYDEGQPVTEPPDYNHVGTLESRRNREEVLGRLGLLSFFTSEFELPHVTT